MQNKLAVTKKNGRRTQYEYDALGNRVAQRVAYTSGNGAEQDATYYVRDAQGNTLSTYTEHTFMSSVSLPQPLQQRVAAHGLQQESVTLYGAARLGEYRPNERDPKTDGGDPAPPDGGGDPVPIFPAEMKVATVNGSLPSFGGVGGGSLFVRLRGHTHYEYTNHLGNVLATTSDRKLSIQNGGTYYTADVLTLMDYYAFGQAIAARGYAGSSYTYSINGQLRDTEIDPNGNHTAALYWEYDSRIGRRWNIDPVVKVWESPYMCFGDNPITGSDVLGNTTNGDFYDGNGKHLGSDGKKDEKMYLIKTQKSEFIGTTEKVPGAGLLKEEYQRAKKFIKENSTKEDAFTKDGKIYDDFVEIESKESTRAAMAKIANQDDGGGSDKPTNNREFGGQIDFSGNVTEGLAGPVTTPIKGAVIGYIPLEGTKTMFHTHPSGEILERVRGELGQPDGSSKTFYTQHPSAKDIANATEQVRYVFGMGGKVSIIYIYNSKGVQATIPLDNFVKLKK